MKNMTSKPNNKESHTTEQKNQSRKFTTTNMVNVYFCLPGLRSTIVVT